MSRREEIDLASSPTDEDCAQLGEPGYEERARQECRIFRNQLLRHAEANGVVLPRSLRLRTKSSSHYFGYYFEVTASYPADDEEAASAAYWFEANLPEKWDEESRIALHLEPVS